MTLGEKLRQARAKRGLSQTQVVGDHMTRNMLSQLENDLASPSVKTLVYLADILGVSPGWLLDDASSCDRVAVKKQIKELYARQDYLACIQLISDLETVPDDEESLLLFRCALSCAEQDLREGNYVRADWMLSCAERCISLYIGEAEWFSLSLLRLKWKMEQGSTDDLLMQTVVEQSRDRLISTLSAEHDLLKGRGYVEKRMFQSALPYLHRAESAHVLDQNRMKVLYSLLERCYKEQEDYKQAYHYATLRMDETDRGGEDCS